MCVWVSTIIWYTCEIRVKMSTCFRLKTFCADEISLKHALFDHPYPRTFARFQFGYPRVYVGWRIFWALYHTVWIIITGVYSYQWAGPETKQQIKWFIYLTDWAYFTLTVATITDACAVLYVYVKRKDILSGSCHETPWYMKATWCITTMASVIGVVMSIAYWGLLSRRELTAVDLETHALNAVYIIINILVTGMPVRLLHFWYSVVYGVVYALFTLFYHLAGGTNALEKPYVYSVIDWRDAGTAVTYSIIVGIVATSVIHVVLYGLYCLKMLVYYNTGCCSGSDEYTFEGKSTERTGETGM